MMNGMDQYRVKQKYRLSTEMFLALCYTAQEHKFIEFVYARTKDALRRRGLLDDDGRLTSYGWKCYLEATESEGCPTSTIEGFTPRDPKALFERARPGLDLTDRKRESDGPWTPRLTSGVVERVKFCGGLVVLRDGRRWEVDPAHQSRAAKLEPGSRLIFVDGMMLEIQRTNPIRVQLDGD